MRKLILALPLLLMSCATPGGAPPDLTTLVSQVIAQCARLCAYQPTFDTVATIVSAFYSPVALAQSVVDAAASAICTAPIVKAGRRYGVSTLTRAVSTPKGIIYVKGIDLRR